MSDVTELDRFLSFRPQLLTGICHLVFWLKDQIQILRYDEFKEEHPEEMVGEVEDFVKASDEEIGGRINICTRSYSEQSVQDALRY